MPSFKHIITSFFVILTICFLSQKTAIAAPVTVNKISFNSKNTLEISVSRKSDFKIFTLKNPPRLVIDIADGKLTASSKKPKLPSFTKSFRNQRESTSLRLVFDLNQSVSVTKTRFEKVKQQNNGKIIAEISGIKTSKKTTPNPGNFIFNKVVEFDTTTIKKAKKAAKKKRLPIIVIDSGHGGKDPGTIGRFARTREKNVTLAYAKELGRQLIRSKRYKVYLTRDTDIFIPLKKRVAIARRRKADLFISLHANAIASPKTSGFSIYTLSERSSDKQAELLARKENRAGIISGVNFSGASKDIMKTLIDLSQRESMNGSSRFASTAVKSMKKSGVNILQNTHRFAGFAVLTAPDMISVLIELGYLSNKREERLLNSLGYKRKVATNLVKAIDEYFSKNKI